MVDATGHAFRAGGEPAERDIAPIRERLPVIPAREASVLGNRELFGRLATTAMLPAMERVVAGWKPNLVLRDPCEYASAVVAHGWGVDAAQVAIGLAAVEWGSIVVAGPALEVRRSGLADELRASPYVTRFPVSLDPSPFPDTRRFRETAPVLRRRLPNWWGGSRAPLVYVTFGTVLGHMSMAAEVYRVAMRAVAGIHARVLLTTGRHFDVTQLGPIPGNVHVESWVDQAHVFAEAEVVVCHGGSGTTFGALGAGVPVVIVPLFADQFANSPKVTEADAGVVVERDGDSHRRTLSEDDTAPITEAVETVLSHSSYRERAHDVAAQMAMGPTADELLAELLAANGKIGSSGSSSPTGR
jgi:hypothetical protein